MEAATPVALWIPDVVARWSPKCGQTRRLSLPAMRRLRIVKKHGERPDDGGGDRTVPERRQAFAVRYGARGTGGIHRSEPRGGRGHPGDRRRAKDPVGAGRKG